MKKSFYFTLLILLSAISSSFAQGYYPYYDYIQYSQGMDIPAKLKKQQVRAYEVVKIKLKNKKKTSKSVLYFNSKGYETGYENYNKKNKLTYAWYTNQLNDSLPLVSSVKNQKGDTTRKSVYTYNDALKATRADYFYKNMLIPKTFQTYTYNLQNNIVKNAQFKNNGKLLYAYEYDYYENGKKKETRYYNKKNKLKYRYTYACSDKGELETQEVKARNYCIKNESLADGSYLKISEYKDEKNRIRKTVATYSKDSLLMQFESFNYKGKLTYKYVYTYNNEKLLNTFNVYNHKGKLLSASKYEYNEKGLKKRMVSLNKKGEEITASEYHYSYHN